MRTLCGKTCGAQEKRCSEPKAALMSSPREEWAAGDLATEGRWGRRADPAERSRFRVGSEIRHARRCSHTHGSSEAQWRESGEERPSRRRIERAVLRAPPSTTTLRAQKPDEGFQERGERRGLIASRNDHEAHLAVSSHGVRDHLPACNSTGRERVPARPCRAAAWRGARRSNIHGELPVQLQRWHVPECELVRGQRRLRLLPDGPRLVHLGVPCSL